MDTTSNRGVIFLIVGAMVFMSCLCVIANCYLAYTGQDSPQSLTLLTGGLVGSLSAMLVKTSPTQSLHPTPIPNGTPPEVVVVNKPEDPIPTTETQAWNTL